MKRIMGLIAACVLAMTAQGAQGAESVHLTLKADGVVIPGDSTQTSLGRANTIECLSFELPATMLSATGVYGKEAQYKPVVIRKRIDKSSPLLFKAMITGQRINGVFRFYRPNPAGDGTTEQFYTVGIDGGFITSVRQYVSDTLMPSSSNMPPLEEVSMNFEKLTLIYVNGDIRYTTGITLPIIRAGVSGKTWPEYGAQESEGQPQSAVTPGTEKKGRAKAQASSPSPKRTGKREVKEAARRKPVVLAKADEGARRGGANKAE